MEAAKKNSDDEPITYGKAIVKGLKGVFRGDREKHKAAIETPKNDKYPQAQPVPESESRKRTPTSSTSLNFSISVNNMVNALGGETEVYSYELVEHLLDSHPNYAESSKKLILNSKRLVGGGKT